METNNKPLFKMVFTLKDNADPVKFAEIIDEMLACYKTYCSNEIHGNIVEFSSSVSKHYGGMWGTLLNALKSKLLRYINGLDWIKTDANGEVEIEDVLSQFLEDHKEDKNGDKQ